MSRFNGIMAMLVIFGPLWLFLVLGFGPGALIPVVWMNILVALPLYLLVTFGCYSLASVGYHVYCIQSDDEAAISLKKDIADAKLDLTTKGLNFHG